MNFALIPWSENELNDGIFYMSGENGNRVPTPTTAYLMQEEFKRLGHVIHTVDLFDDLTQVDFFLFYVLDWNWVSKLAKLGLENRMVYCNAEPPTVTELNTPKGFGKLKRYFPYILTWNPDWIDNKRIFLRVIPYYFEFCPCCIPYGERKLITAISANKKSNWKDELYTERENAYNYFETYYPNEFDFYGVGWENTNHPCYRGTVKDKKQIFHNYRFAICFENTRTKKNYITEKIWDCLNAQIVPVYAGAGNITDYIPEECFIDFYKFNSYDELANHLEHMTQECYNGYLEAARKLLANDEKIAMFRGERYAHNIIDAVSHTVAFSMGFKEKILLRVSIYVKRSLLMAKKWIKDKIKK